MLPIKTYLKDVVRIKNPSESRLGYLRLDKNENPILFPEELVSKIRDAVNADFLMMYPETDPLYKKIAHWLNCKEENLYLTSGSDAAIKNVFEVFVEPGDTVMILDPTYAMYYVYINLFRAKLSPLQYGENLSLSCETILDQIRTVRPKLVCIANPNSPTGTVLKVDEIEAIVTLSQELGVVVLIDEAYFLYWPETAVPLIKKYDHLVITRTFSKAIGLAAARLGFVIGHQDIIKPLHTFRPMYEVNGLAVKAGEILLDHLYYAEANVRAALEGKAYLERELEKKGIPFYKSYANFLHIRIGSTEKSRELVQKLHKDKILVAGGFKNILHDCLRVSIGDVRQMETFLKAFLKHLD